jgi:phosphohistidine phosphatase
MRLTLVRHAIAAPADDDTDDFSRALTRRGRKRFTHVVAGLDTLGVRFTHLLHSPKVRALETATLLAPLVQGQLEPTRLLVGKPTPALLTLLSRHDELAVVGHEPHLTTLLSWLTVAQNARASGQTFELKKGAVAMLEGTPTPGGMNLTALIPPRVFRRVG